MILPDPLWRERAEPDWPWRIRDVLDHLEASRRTPPASPRAWRIAVASRITAEELARVRGEIAAKRAQESRQRQRVIAAEAEARDRQESIELMLAWARSLTGSARATIAERWRMELDREAPRRRELGLEDVMISGARRQLAAFVAARFPPPAEWCPTRPVEFTAGNNQPEAKAVARVALKDLSTISKGRGTRPPGIVIYGTDGVGKTTIAADAPAPVFLGPEDGAEHLDLPRIPTNQIARWSDVLDWMQTLVSGQHGYRTFIADTLDWIEPLIHAHIARAANVKHIEDIKYAAGYKQALDEWRVFLRACDALRTRGMMVILIAHAKVAKWDPPDGESFVRWGLKLHDKDSASAVELVCEWASMVLFAKQDWSARKANKWDRKGAGSGRRLLHTESCAAWRAKNRHCLPPVMEMSWATIAQHLGRASTMTGQELQDALAEIRALAEALPDPERASTMAWCGKAVTGPPLDRALVAKVLNRVRVRLDEIQEPEQDDEPEEQAQDPGEPAAGWTDAMQALPAEVKQALAGAIESTQAGARAAANAIGDQQLADAVDPPAETAPARRRPRAVRS